MLTVKLYGDRLAPITKIVEAREVNIIVPYPGVYLIELVDFTGVRHLYYVADPSKPCPDIAGVLEFWHCAYVENANGKTVDSIRFHSVGEKQ